MKKLILFTDGGARGNPGPAAIGVIIKDEKGTTVETYGKYLGEQTNNFAEYSALISGLKKARELGAEEVECFVDSQLLAEQLNRHWKIKEPNLQKLFIQAWNETQKFKKVTIKHTLRQGNKEADTEVNRTLDQNTYPVT